MDEGVARGDVPVSHSRPSCPLSQKVSGNESLRPAPLPPRGP